MKFVDLEFENRLSVVESSKRFSDIEESGKYLMGENVKELEKAFALDQEVKNCVLVKNATDALAMTFKHLESHKRTVIVPQFGAYPTVMAALQSSAREIISCPVDNTLTMDITKVKVPRGSIIVPVNLYGNRCNIELIRQAADSAGDCFIVEDCAQSTGLKNLGLSDFMVHSFYPTKPMGCRGDGGAILTNNEEAAAILSKARFYGLGDSGVIESWGINSRIDEWQAALLISKLKNYRDLNEKRRSNALQYPGSVGNVKHSADCVYHQYVQMYSERDKVREILSDLHIPTMIHYPKMLDDMPFLLGKVKFSECKRVSDHVLSIPVGPHLTVEEVTRISQALESVADRRISFEEIA